MPQNFYLRQIYMLPKNALYTNAINTSYARNYNNNIAPQNGLGPYSGGETIIINIPTGRNNVMSGADSLLKFSATVTNGIDNSSFVRLDKAGAHSFIQRVRVFHGSTLLSDIDNYNNLVGMMMVLQTSNDAFHGKHSILTGTEQMNVTTEKIIVVADTNAVTVPLISGRKLSTGTLVAGATTDAVTFTIPLMNFLNYSDKYIPLFALTGAPLRLEIQLVSSAKLAVCSHKALTSFSINRVEYICNFMEISDVGMGHNQNVINETGALEWVVQDYRNYSSTADIDTGVELTVPLPAKFNSLRSLFVSFRGNYPGFDAAFPLDSTHYSMSEYTFRLGSKTVPTKPPGSVPEFFGELLRAIGCVSDLNHEPSINLTNYDVESLELNNEDADTPSINSGSACFFVGLDLESYSNSGLNDVYQGYNSTTDDIFFNPRFGTVTAGAGSVRIDSYAYFDQVIIIKDGFASTQF